MKNFELFTTIVKEIVNEVNFYSVEDMENTINNTLVFDVIDTEEDFDYITIKANYVDPITRETSVVVFIFDQNSYLLMNAMDLATAIDCGIIEG